jgi:hypothetical protein
VRLVWGMFCGWGGPVRDPYSLVPDGGGNGSATIFVHHVLDAFLCGFSEGYAGGRGWICPCP